MLLGMVFVLVLFEEVLEEISSEFCIGTGRWEQEPFLVAILQLVVEISGDMLVLLLSCS